MFRPSIVLLILSMCALSACAGQKKAQEDPAPLTNNEKPTDLFRVTPEGVLTRGDTSMELLFWAVGPVATVDGEAITEGHFNRESYKMQKVTGGRIPPEYATIYVQKLVEQIVEKTLLGREVEADGIEVPKDLVDAELQQMRESSPRVFEMITGDGKMTMEELREEVRQQLAIRLLLKKRYGLEVSEEEIARYYDENADRYEQEEQVSARHILFKLDSEASPDEIEAARKRAEEVMLLAKQPDEDFGELAKQYSEGPSAPKGGDLGYFPAKRMVEPFSKAAFALQIGEVSEPVKTQFGWHLIKVEGKKPARTVPFEEVKDQIREQLEAKQLRNAYGTLLDEVKAKAEVTMLFENIRYRGDVSSETPEP